MSAIDIESIIKHIERFGVVNKSDAPVIVAEIRRLQKIAGKHTPEGLVNLDVPYQLEEFIKLCEKLKSEDIEVLTEIARKFSKIK